MTQLTIPAMHLIDATAHNPAANKYRLCRGQGIRIMRRKTQFSKTCLIRVQYSQDVEDGNSLVRPAANMKPRQIDFGYLIVAKSRREHHHIHAPENGQVDILGGSTQGNRLHPGRLKSDGHVGEGWRPNIVIMSSRTCIQQVIDMGYAHL